MPGVTRAVEQKRLAVVETLMMGPRQRLFIIRRDNVEHLIFAGPEGALPGREYSGTSASGLRIASAQGSISMNRLKSLAPLLVLAVALLAPGFAFAGDTCGRHSRSRQWRAFHRSQRQRPFHRPHGADHRADHDPVSIAPSILIMMTCFVRMVVVLSLLRTALGLQTTPAQQRAWSRWRCFSRCS